MRLVRAGLIACVLFCASGAAALQAGGSRPAPAYVARRTSFGQPSLEGVWTSNYLLSLESPPGVTLLTLLEPQARALAAKVAKETSTEFAKYLDPEVPALMQTIGGLSIVRGERRTRMVVLPADGHVPYTPQGRKEAEGPPPDEGLDNPEDRPSAERCLVGTGQPPLTSLAYASPLQILQTPGHVVIHTEYGDDVRIIPFDVKHGPPTTYSKMGDSIARWEGATLVIETIGMPERDRFHLFPTLIVSGDSKVIERLTRVSDRELLYQFTVIDPKVYAAPWMGEFSWYASSQRIFEHACHEGNYSLPGILRGARQAEATARAATTPR